MYGAQIWFDGGIEGKARPAITAMLKKLQPKAVAFNGCVVQGGVEPSPPCLLPISYARPEPVWADRHIISRLVLPV